MNASECKVANWEIIGLEDGSKGRQTSYIGEHRQACSGYAVTPDLNAYLKGHAEGLRQFCTESNGYQQGLNGYQNNQLCPADLASAFNRNYVDGYRIYQVRSEIGQLTRQIQSSHHRLNKISKTIKIKEEALVTDATQEYRRRELLDEIKELERESASMLIELDQMEARLVRLESKYHRMINKTN